MAAKVILLALRIALGGLFIYAGVTKAWQTEEFARAIQHYQLIPWPDVRLLLAVYLPWLEIFSGLAVIFRRLYLGALVAILVMMLAFTAALGSAWSRGLDISCGCFGKEEKSVRTHFPSLLARDLAILAAAATLLVAERGALSARLAARPR